MVSHYWHFAPVLLAMMLLINKIRAEQQYSIVRQMVRQAYSVCQIAGHVRLNIEEVYFESSRCKPDTRARLRLSSVLRLFFRGWI